VLENIMDKILLAMVFGAAFADEDWNLPPAKSVPSIEHAKMLI
jgi:hypothetical protein